VSHATGSAITLFNLIMIIDAVSEVAILYIIMI